MKPISEYIKPPITVDEALTKSQKEKPFRKPDLLQTFQDLVRTEAQVLQDSYASHLEQHVKDVYAERKKRNLNVSDLEDAMEAYRQPEQEQKPQEMAMDDKQEEKRGQADGKDATKIDGVNSGKSDAMET
uniref:Uncharacterized protein n=1 Tax=Craspedostauros australis TaxID=1486917 RepID=A0A7R9WRC5_9STRA